MRGLRGARLRLTIGMLLVAAAATAGCSLLIGVSGDPVVVDEGIPNLVEAAAEGGDVDKAIAEDAATADASNGGDADADADDGAQE